MGGKKKRQREERDFNLFRELYERKLGGKFPVGKIEHRTDRGPDFVVREVSGALGVEHTELFKERVSKGEYSPKEREAFREKIINDALNLCKRKKVPPLEVKVLFKSVKQVHGSKSQFKLSEGIASAVERAAREKQEDIFDLKHAELNLPEVHEISVIRGTLEGTTWLQNHRWYEIKASWVNRNFVSELQACIDRKSDKYYDYRKNCTGCWLLIVTNKNKDSQAFEITREILQNKYGSRFERSFYLEVFFKELYELITGRISIVQH